MNYEVTTMENMQCCHVGDGDSDSGRGSTHVQKNDAKEWELLRV